MIELLYGKKTLPFNEEKAAVIRSKMTKLNTNASGAQIVRKAMAHPIGSQRLCEMARGKKTCTIIISDHTRPVPSRDIIPSMLMELREGAPNIEITLLVATGCHRGTTAEELREKLGEELCAKEEIVVHDCTDVTANVRIGVLPSGAPLVINRLAAETELLVAEGLIEPHFFAGFSGGRKSVLPGVCARATVLGNHCSEFIDSKYARAGRLDGNPIQKDMIAACRAARLKYIVNVVIDNHKRTVKAFAGDPERAHAKGCGFLSEYCVVLPVYGEIVITTNGGAPLDQNVYQCVKGLTTAEATASEGAVIIMCAECSDGVGGDEFYRFLAECETVGQLYQNIMATPQQETVQDQWQAQVLARILGKHTVIFVTRRELKVQIEDMKMIYAGSLEEALRKAKKIKGSGARVTVIPDGISVVIGNCR